MGINPLLVTNAGIYGLDDRPLGLLISPKGKLHDADTRMDKGSAGTFRGTARYSKFLMTV